jgi:DNA-binding NtrC family response regulator
MPRVQGQTTLLGDEPTASGRILLVVGSTQLITHPLTGDDVVIGRAPECNVVIDHRALSRRHAVLRVQPALTIQDLGSMNGIRLANGTIRGGEPAPLALGESFRIGPFAFLVVDADPAAPSTDRTGRDRLVVEDPTLEGVSTLVREIARTEVNVVILGETGVGKEVLAHTLHTLSGRRGPLSSVNCAALSENLLESELFGHEKGAFTGAVGRKEGLLEASVGGTVFLDEIGELPLPLQAKLLRAVESREVRRLGSTKSIPIDIRIIAATNRELAAEVAAGRFRQDLFFRLDGVSFRIPPLRERRHAIGPLALRFIDEAARRLGRSDVRATPELLVALAAHDWPGNVRELRAVIDRAVLLARGDQLASRHLAFASAPVGTARPAPEPARVAAAQADDHAPADLTAEERAERARIIELLEACGGNQTRAAKQLGLARSTFVTKLRLYRIPRPRS